MSSCLVLDGPDGPVKFTLTDQPATLGRAPDVAFRIDDRSLSAHHARFDPARPLTVH